MSHGTREAIALRRAPHSCRIFRCGRYKLDTGSRTFVMGIVNVTPDSFSDGGVYFRRTDKALERIVQMVRDGADIIDVGGESTRPGAEAVSVEEELERVIPVIRLAAREVDVPLSIDTSKSAVAEEALQAGASIVNDVTGLKSDPDMAPVIARYGAGVVVMHMKGTPRTMQDDPVYRDVVAEVLAGLGESVALALAGGIEEERVAVDPGIGFGKTAAHSIEILNRLDRFTALGRPVMAGVSRKSFIGAITGKGVNDRLMGTAAACAVALTKGAAILRVHDMKEIAELVRVMDVVLGKRRLA